MSKSVKELQAMHVIASGRSVHMLIAQDTVKTEFAELSHMRDVCALLL